MIFLSKFVGYIYLNSINPYKPCTFFAMYEINKYYANAGLKTTPQQPQQHPRRSNYLIHESITKTVIRKEETIK